MIDFIKDPSFYNFVRGPLVWIAFLTFIFGSMYRVYTILKLVRKDKVILPYLNSKYIARSFFHWLVPFNTYNWRRRPVITTITFSFHVCLVFTPIFLLAHSILWRESFGVSWWSLPERLADIMTLIVIFSCVFFFLRRLFAPEVRFVTFSSDYLILALSCLPFLTGFLAYHQMLLSHKTMVILHMAFGSAMLIAIPFTRLAHMVFFFLTRAYLASEAGVVRRSKDW